MMLYMRVPHLTTAIRPPATDIQGQRDSEQQEIGVFRGAHDQVDEIASITRGVRLNNLRIKSRLEIPNEAIDRRLHLISYTHGGVYRHAEKEIQQDIQSLRGSHIGHSTEQAPAGEPQQRTV